MPKLIALRNGAVAAALMAGVFLLAAPAVAQDYPNRPITLIVPFPPGGSTTIVGRIVADKMSEVLGQSIVAESGSPGFDAVLSYGLVAPAGTPQPIIERLNKELRAALATDEVKRRLYQEGAEPMATTPEEHAALIDREESKWSVLIKSIGLKPE